MPGDALRSGEGEPRTGEVGREGEPPRTGEKGDSARITEEPISPITGEQARESPRTGEEGREGDPTVEKAVLRPLPWLGLGLGYIGSRVRVRMVRVRVWR